VMGLLMAGWGSANKYAMLGGLRAAGQLISYEIPFIMSILGVAMLVQSLNLITIVDGQANYGYALVQPLGLFIFLMAGLAELGRTPFDIHHAESELVGGPFIEYSGAHWAVFFLAEYINTFTVAVLIVLLFLGGWHFPWWSLTQPEATQWYAVVAKIGVLCAKICAFLFVMMWLRWTLPRFRFDQLMRIAWLGLIPMTLGLLMITVGLLYFGLHRSWVWTCGGDAVVLVLTLIYMAVSRKEVSGRTAGMNVIGVGTAAG